MLAVHLPIIGAHNIFLRCGVLALSLTPVCPVSILPNFSSINPNLLVNYATIRVSMVIFYLYVMAVYAMLIRASLALSNLNLNTVFVPWNPS